MPNAWTWLVTRLMLISAKLTKNSFTISMAVSYVTWLGTFSSSSNWKSLKFGKIKILWGKDDVSRILLRLSIIGLTNYRPSSFAAPSLNKASRSKVVGFANNIYCSGFWQLPLEWLSRSDKEGQILALMIEWRELLLAFKIWLVTSSLALMVWIWACLQHIVSSALQCMPETFL